jgi:microcystin-dependent protein
MNAMHKLIASRWFPTVLLVVALVTGGGIWGGQTQHTHRSAAEGGVISWIPTGFVGCYAGPTVPANTLESYGQAVSRVTYSTLFGIVGTTYGAGDGVTTFNLPDLRGRMVIGMDNMGGASANRVTAAAADTLGGTGGSEIISIAQMPVHDHSGQNIDVVGGGSQSGDVGNYSHGGPATGSPAGSFNVKPNGGGQPYNQPFLALKCVIGT